MSVKRELLDVLDRFGWKSEQDFLPEAERPEKYIVYNLPEEEPSAFADDVPTEEYSSVRVHMYMPAQINYLKDKQTLKNLLFRGGFDAPTMVLNIVEDDTEMRHICLETGITKESEVN